MIKNVIFDCGQVMIEFNAPRMLAYLGAYGEAQDLLVRQIYQGPEWRLLDQGVITEQQTVDAVCRRVPAEYHGVVEAFVTGWWKQPFVPIPGMEDLMRELKAAGYGLYVLSNVSDSYVKFKDRLPGIELFDGVFASSDYKLLKPEPEIYQTFLKTFSLDAAECVFIDDVAANVAGAERCGIRGIRFTGDTEKLKEQLWPLLGHKISII